MSIIDPNEEGQRSLDLASEEERETARTMVSRLHVELGLADPQGMIDSLRSKHAHRLTIATAKKFGCSACEESEIRRLHLVAARVLREWCSCLLVDQFEWRHLVLIPARVGNNHDGCWKSCRLRDKPKSHGPERGLGNVTNYVEYVAESLDLVLWRTKHYQHRSRRSVSRSGGSTWSCCQEHPFSH